MITYEWGWGHQNLGTVGHSKYCFSRAQHFRKWPSPLLSGTSFSWWALTVYFVGIGDIFIQRKSTFSWPKPQTHTKHEQCNCLNWKQQKKVQDFSIASCLDHLDHLCPTGTEAVWFSREWPNDLFSDVLNEFAYFVPHFCQRFFGLSWLF